MIVSDTAKVVREALLKGREDLRKKRVETGEGEADMLEFYCNVRRSDVDALEKVSRN